MHTDETPFQGIVRLPVIVHDSAPDISRQAFLLSCFLAFLLLGYSVNRSGPSSLAPSIRTCSTTSVMYVVSITE